MLESIVDKIHVRSPWITRMTGGDHLEAVEIRNDQTGEMRSVETPAVFTFIGARAAHRLAAL
ncbi:MAG: hypothetical protein WKF84_10230 [Pyrinomonadaceae bacterium]